MSLEPKPIRKLEQDVINRIAAGEVIQRPANALKELIENSLDAKSTNIQVTVKNGGLKLLQIQDNGTGIRKEDFEIVCERFTTSKLQEFEDLHKISTYGFRGEALASISHVAHLTITSKTKKDICAYQAEYCDGKLKAPPKPLAGNQGTIITVEDLFYNMSVRKKALGSAAEQYQRISEVVSKYSVHNANVGFSLKKSGDSNDIRTPANSTHTENIRLIYGGSIARELIEFSTENEQLKFKAKGHMTNVNYSNKKMQFLLFINHRLVDCQSLKKCLDTVYQTYLPKNAHPFVYLSLELDPNNIDINVHPTKHEVHFLNETQIVDCIVTALEQKLLGSNNSRVFYTQTKLPTLHFETNRHEMKDKPTNISKSEAPKFTIRTDTNIQKLEKFFGPSVKKADFDEIHENNEKSKKQHLNLSLTEDELHKKHQEFLNEQEDFENNMLNKTEDIVMIEDSPPKNNTNTKNKPIVLEPDIDMHDKQCSPEKQSPESSKDYISASQNSFANCIPALQEEKRMELPLNKQFIKKITRVETKLTSVLQLRKTVEENCHRTLRETFAQHVFVGSISPSQALIQYGTQLLLCNTKTILEEFFYQMVLYNFQNFDSYRFDSPMPIKDLALMGLDLPETGWTEEDGPKDELAERIREILTEKRAMLSEYFSVDIDENGGLKSLPILLENYIPDAIQVPMYLVRLATEVNWETEKECFETFSRETGKFYSNVSLENDENDKDWKWITEYILYPAVKEYFMPPKCFAQNGAVLEIANLPNLYKVFERC